MSSDTQPASDRAITHQVVAHRFYCSEEGHDCVLEYTLQGQVANFYHTGVPSAVGGRGIAAELVRFGLETARTLGWKVRPTCSYVAAYVNRHPEYDDIILHGQP